MQDKPELSENRKPNISETSVNHRQRQLKQELGCQKLKTNVRPAKRPTFSVDYEVSDGLFRMGESEICLIRKTDLAWMIRKLDLSNLNEGVHEVCYDQAMPLWSALNYRITDECIPLDDFLPVLLCPITLHHTVYTAMKNFQNVLGQLQQSHWPVTSDEGVYHIAREIVMNRPQEFSNLTILLGSFHIIKAVMGAIGKYAKDSGAETALVEAQVFGQNVVKSVYDGSHYVRSLKGLTMLSESIERLQWTEFFKIKGVESYMNELQILSKLKTSVSKKNRPDRNSFCKHSWMVRQIKYEDFNSCRSEQRLKAETFSNSNHFVQMVDSFVLSVLRRINTQKFLYHVIQTRALRFFGYIIRREELQRMPLDGKMLAKRNRGRPRMNWANNISQWTGLNYIEATRREFLGEDWHAVVSNPLN